MGIIAQQDGNYSMKTNEIVFCEGENARYLNILLQGKVDVYINPFGTPANGNDESVLGSSFRIFSIDQNTFIGAIDLFGEGKYSYSYRASSDSNFYTFLVDSPEKLNELFNIRKEYPAYIVSSISDMIERSFSTLTELENLIREFGVAADNLSVYFWMQKEELGFAYTPSSTYFRDNLDNVQKLRDKGYSLYPELNAACFDADYSAIYEKDYKVTDGINLEKLEYLGRHGQRLRGGLRGRMLQDFLHHLARNARVQQGLALAHLVDRADQLSRVRIFQHVSHGAGFDRRKDLVVANKAGQHQHVGVRLLGGNLPGGFNPVHLRHEQVHQNDIRFELFGLINGFQAVLCFSNYLYIACLCQEGFDPLPDDGMVIDDEHPDDSVIGRH
jgi:hypothetical protein